MITEVGVTWSNLMDTHVLLNDSVLGLYCSAQAISCTNRTCSWTLFEFLSTDTWDSCLGLTWFLWRMLFTCSSSVHVRISLKWTTSWSTCSRLPSLWSDNPGWRYWRKPRTIDTGLDNSFGCLELLSQASCAAAHEELGWHGFHLRLTVFAVFLVLSAVLQFGQC